MSPGTTIIRAELALLARKIAWLGSRILGLYDLASLVQFL
jgi:hypothetical protein